MNLDSRSSIYLTNSKMEIRLPSVNAFKENLYFVFCNIDRSEIPPMYKWHLGTTTLPNFIITLILPITKLKLYKVVFAQ